MSVLACACLALTLQSRRPSVAQRIVAEARTQVRESATYDPSYVRLAYPMGDLPRDRGVCTDVVVRCLRAVGRDLQSLIHQDMKTRFATYPRRGKRPDPNIDHRRVPNQTHFLRKFGRSLPLDLTDETKGDWRPGDLVYWKLDSGLDHAGVLTDARGTSGWPMVVHNLSRTTEEDCLTRWRVIGHFRYP
ncbi:MAG: DUF1287 domain-containing protein [Fimbriimonadaceae bacterium]|nr:DUF1287 domain-containing protein [Fimbriimonadaceae bacterium]